MRDKGLLPDLIVALVILIGMFAMLVHAGATVRFEEAGEPRQPECNNLYQRSTKEVLRCD